MAKSERANQRTSEPANERTSEPGQGDAANSGQESVGDAEQIQQSDATGHQLSDADEPAQVKELPGESTVEVLTNQAERAELARPEAHPVVRVKTLISLDPLSSEHAARAVVTYAEGELLAGTAGENEHALVNAIADVAIEPGAFPCGEVPCRIAARYALTNLFKSKPGLVRHVEDRGTALLTQGVDFPIVVVALNAPATR